MKVEDARNLADMHFPNPDLLFKNCVAITANLTGAMPIAIPYDFIAAKCFGQFGEAFLRQGQRSKSAFGLFWLKLLAHGELIADI